MLFANLRLNSWGTLQPALHIQRHLAPVPRVKGRYPTSELPCETIVLKSQTNNFDVLINMEIVQKQKQ